MLALLAALADPQQDLGGPLFLMLLPVTAQPSVDEIAPDSAQRQGTPEPSSNLTVPRGTGHPQKGG